MIVGYEGKATDQQLQLLAVRKLQKLLSDPSASPQSRERVNAILDRINRQGCEYQRARAANDNLRMDAKAKSHARHPIKKQKPMKVQARIINPL